MNHFDKRSLERIGFLIDTNDLKAKILDGVFDVIHVEGNRYHVEVPHGSNRYLVIYDYEHDALVTVWKVEPQPTLSKVKHGKKGKHRQTVPKKLVPMIAYDRR